VNRSRWPSRIHAGLSFRHVLFAGVALLCSRAASSALANESGAQPPRLRRADSFLGVHFDFHAREDCTAVGSNTTPAMVARMLDRVRPDYIQIDCKGHPGYSSYPTKVGNPVPGFVGDPLRVWRQVTAAKGVALFMHYSGVWDSAAVARHPEWAAVGADGKPNTKATSVFGPYADELLIPQLRELAGVYGVDGAWIDGECWATVPDYGEKAAKAFRDATGIQALPKKPADPHWLEFLQFHREAFRGYLRHYLAAVAKTHPEFQLCSNWAFTDHMAEPVSAPVAFLSGDYAPDDSVNSARLSARYLVRQGLPWDLMAWSFSRKKGADGKSLQKSAPQLEREAAVVVALGGGFQAYFKQKRDGSIYEEQMPVMAETAAFCRERQALCHRSEPVPQVAVLLSTAGHYRKISGLFNRELSGVGGVLQALLESQLSVEVVGEHQIAGRLSEYPLIVVPEWAHLEPAFKSDLVAYVKVQGRKRTDPRFRARRQNRRGRRNLRYAAGDSRRGGAARGFGRGLGQGPDRSDVCGPWPELQRRAQPGRARLAERPCEAAVSEADGRGARLSGRGCLPDAQEGPAAGEPRQHLGSAPDRADPGGDSAGRPACGHAPSAVEAGEGHARTRLAAAGVRIPRRRSETDGSATRHPPRDRGRVSQNTLRATRPCVSIGAIF